LRRNPTLALKHAVGLPRQPQRNEFLYPLACAIDVANHDKRIDNPIRRTLPPGIVGGGAGGLELATDLGDKLGKQRKALVTLVDTSRTCGNRCCIGSRRGAWTNDHELDYLYQARWHHFQFCLGRMDGDRAREIHLAPTLDEAGREVIPRRSPLTTHWC
jgi:hypothetical protein